MNSLLDILVSVKFSSYPPKPQSKKLNTQLFRLIIDFTNYLISGLGLKGTHVRAFT